MVSDAVLPLSSNVPPFSVTVLTELPAASSFNVSVLPVSVRISALVPPEVIAPVISSVPPLAVICPADPLVPVTAAVTLPSPVIVRVPIVIPLASVRIEALPSSFSVPLPIAICVPTVNVPAVFSSSVLLDEKVSVCAALAASSNSLSPAPVIVRVRALPVSVIAEAISNVPPEAVIEAAPVAVIAPVTLPNPVIVPVLREIPALSVSCELEPSSLTVLVPTVSALARVSVPLVFSSSVPVEPENESEVAALPASSSSLSLASLPTGRATDLLSVIAEAISNVPPVAVICAAPVAVIAPVTLPNPVIVPVLSEIPALSVSCELEPSSLTVLVPTVSALARVSVPLVFSSSVPVEPEKLSDVAALPASSNSLSLAPLPTVSASEPLLARSEARREGPPEAVIAAAPVGEIAPVTLPTPVIVPVLSEIPALSVS